MFLFCQWNLSERLCAVQFQEHEKKMRLAARTALHGEGSEGKEGKDSKDDYKTATGDASQAYGGSEEEKAQPKQESAAGPKAAGAKAAQHKPAWAMTEEAAGAQDEELALGEEEALLDFAKSLDFDRYMGDVEVQAVMERLRKRIADLEREVAADDQRSADSEAKAALRSRLEQMVGITKNITVARRGG